MRTLDTNIAVSLILNEEPEKEQADSLCQTINYLIKAMPCFVHDGNNLMAMLKGIDHMEQIKKEKLLKRARDFIIKCGQYLHKHGSALYADE